MFKKKADKKKPSEGGQEQQPPQQIQQPEQLAQKSVEQKPGSQKKSREEPAKRSERDQSNEREKSLDRSSANYEGGSIDSVNKSRGKSATSKAGSKKVRQSTEEANEEPHEEEDGEMRGEARGENEEDFHDEEEAQEYAQYEKDMQEVESRNQSMMQSKKKKEIPWTAYDFLFPAGILAKLVKIPNVDSKDIVLLDILNKIKLPDDGLPVVVLAGAKESDRGKFYAGAARACFRTDACIVDSGIAVGIEPFALRRNLRVVGVCPENEVKFPKINPTAKDPFELSNGHTHLFLLNNKENAMKWGQECRFKYNLAIAIATGNSAKRGFSPRCKIVVVLLGDFGDPFDDLIQAVKHKLPIIVVRGSDACNDIIDYLQKGENSNLKRSYLREYLDQGFFYILENNNSEEIAAYLHFFLTVTPFDVTKGAAAKKSVVRKVKQREESSEASKREPRDKRDAREVSKEKPAAVNNSNANNSVPVEKPTGKKKK